MKRYDNLYERICSIENLRLAEKRARKGKEGTYGVKVFDRDAEQNLWRLHDTLMARGYRTSEYSIFRVHEPKERVIYRLPFYPDRIMHHAIMNVMEEIWTSVFTHNTYSCIKGRGIEACRKRVRRVIDEHKDKRLYCLKIDIRKFYPSIKHRVLKRIVRRKIKDEDTLRLIDEIIDSVNMDSEGKPLRTAAGDGDEQGVPIGNYLSQYLANLTLCYVMHWANERMAEEIRAELRLKRKPWIESAEYADDIVFMAESKEVLRAVMRGLRRKIEGELELRIKDNWQVFPIARNRRDSSGRGLDYVGYVFYMEHTMMRKSIKKNLMRHVARLRRSGRRLTEREYRMEIAPWYGWAVHSDSRFLMLNVEGGVLNGCALRNVEC